MNHAVSKVDWSDKDLAKVTCQNGKEFKADFVISTVSLGVLKANQAQLFVPALPARKATAVQKFGFHTHGKIFLEFDNAFWDSEFKGIEVMFG